MSDDSDASTTGTTAPARDGTALQGEESRLRVTGVIETTMCCPDLDAAETFYTEVLGLEVFAKDEGRHLFFRFGGGMLLLFNPHHTSVKVTTVGDARMPLHGTTGAGHVAFRADEDEIERWKQRLGEHRVDIESEVHWPEGGRSIFFRDPAGNCLEFTTPITWGLDA